MFQTFKNAWKNTELRTKLLFTLLIIVLFRIGASIPVPYVAKDAMEQFQYSTQGSILAYMGSLNDAFGQATLFALSVSPYITSSIVMQLLGVAFPTVKMPLYQHQVRGANMALLTFGLISPEGGAVNE